MKMTNREYDGLVKKSSPGTKHAKNAALAFISGGGVCMLGQGISDLLLFFGVSVSAAKVWMPVALIFLGALFTGLRVYDKLARHAGAGTIIPITGFSNAVVSPAMEYRSEGVVAGVCTKMFTIAGPVIVFGTVGAFVYGIILCLLRR